MNHYGCTTLAIASNKGIRTNLMNPTCDEALVILSGSIKGAEGNPTVFSMFDCKLGGLSGLLDNRSSSIKNEASKQPVKNILAGVFRPTAQPPQWVEFRWKRHKP